MKPRGFKTCQLEDKVRTHTHRRIGEAASHGFTHHRLGDFLQGREGRVALEAELTDESWSWEVGHIQTEIIVVVSKRKMHNP